MKNVYIGDAVRTIGVIIVVLIMIPFIFYKLFTMSHNVVNADNSNKTMWLYEITYKDNNDKVITERVEVIDVFCEERGSTYQYRTTEKYDYNYYIHENTVYKCKKNDMNIVEVYKDCVVTYKGVD